MKTLILDNYDSFTFNLYQEVGELGGNPIVERNDAVSINDVRRLGITHIIISPGPGNPYTKRDVGISEELIDYAATQKIPLLGVCLGHQVLGKHFGATVSRAPSVYHGKASTIHVKGKSRILNGLESAFEAMRYHSLSIEPDTIPKSLHVTATSDDGVVMAMEHETLPLFGVQFHPESIGTPHGKDILKNFLSVTQEKPPDGISLTLGKISMRKPYLLASREARERTEIAIRPRCVIGSKTQIVVIAGPCSVESSAQMDEAAAMVKAQGVTILRGGAFKPRTGPYCFQGLGEQGLKLLKQAGEKYQLATISEAMSPEQVELVEEYCDMIQIGTRNMQNYDLLRRVGKSTKPVLLKRGLSATLEEFLLAAEHILAQGNENVILCERGIRTFETEVRFTLALGSIPPLRKLTHLPILVDPSHAAGDSEFVPDYARAAVAMGCDGLIMEVHPHPEEALSDGKQSLSPTQLHSCMEELQSVAAAMGKSLAQS
ncbi:MAG: 3-deoxy-7-phosphoheptulonate synthase [Candidatus Peribacter sp.]|jgi:3-deoxy-7-phosphoheptulonate synthase